MNRSVDIPENFSLLISMDVPMNLRPMSLTTQSYRYVVAGVGTLLNMLVVVVIYNSRQLHYPRHVFWAAISVMNQFHIIYNIVEIIAIVGRNQVACQIFVLNAGVPYTIVLTFLAMAAFDRYLAVARYEWYKEKVTNRGIIFLLSIVFIVTYLIITSPFSTGFKNIQNCTVNLTHIHVILIYDLILGIVCVILHVMIFIRSRTAIKQQPSQLRQNRIPLQFIPTPSTNVVPGTYTHLLSSKRNYHSFGNSLF
jgi:5-hydroxytryptamine receptor 1